MTAPARDLFSTPDAGEIQVGQRIADFGPNDLLGYIQTMAVEVLGSPIPVDYHRDRSVLRWFSRTYGAEHGDVLKYIFLVKQGHLFGEPFRIGLLSATNRRRLDALLGEVRSCRANLESPQSVSQAGNALATTLNFGTLSEL